MEDARDELLRYCVMASKIKKDLDCDTLIMDVTIEIIEKIRAIVRNGYFDDGDAMSEIVSVLGSYGIDCGLRKKPSGFYTIQ